MDARIGGNEMVPVFGGMLMLGLVALVAGSALHVEPRVMQGIAIGCIPTGLLGVALSLGIARWLAATRPDLAAKRDDERIQFLNQRASHTTLHILYGYLGLYTLLSPLPWLQNWSHTAFGAFTLALMTVIYWTTLALYSRRY